jgi:hypothetical protein
MPEASLVDSGAQDAPVDSPAVRKRVLLTRTDLRADNGAQMNRLYCFEQ